MQRKQYLINNNSNNSNNNLLKNNKLLNHNKEHFLKYKEQAKKICEQKVNFWAKKM